jgi:hypothetical protein
MRARKFDNLAIGSNRFLLDERDGEIVEKVDEFFELGSCNSLSTLSQEQSIRKLEIEEIGGH